MPSFKGSKKGGNHSTLIQDAVSVVDFARKDPSVSKISPGIIRPGGKRFKMSLKATLQTGCVLVTVRGKTAVQEIRIYAININDLKEQIEKEFA